MGLVQGKTVQSLFPVSAVQETMVQVESLMQVPIKGDRPAITLSMALHVSSGCCWITAVKSKVEIEIMVRKLYLSLFSEVSAIVVIMLVLL